MTFLPNLPKYRSHKIVQGFRIADIEDMRRQVPSHVPPDAPRPYLLTGSGTLNVRVSPQYVEKHQPQVGGYYVRYADGYESWSPAEAFEGGYTLLDDQPVVDRLVELARSHPQMIEDAIRTLAQALPDEAGDERS